jgi:hypothetical protein
VSLLQGHAGFVICGTGTSEGAARLYMMHAVAQWLRHCATNRKVAGSIPDGVIGIFN